MGDVAGFMLAHGKAGFGYGHGLERAQRNKKLLVGRNIVDFEQAACHVELAGFDDLARFACAFREYPRRVFTQELGGKRVASSTISLANTLVVLYADLPNQGRYVSYQATAGKESCSVTDSTQDISHYAPIVHAESDISPLPARDDSPPDMLHPVKIRDLGSLARLSYDPEFPDEQDMTLYAVPHEGSWVLGYITILDMDKTYYSFNYVALESGPEKNFLKYRGSKGSDPVFADTFEHGYTYLPIIKVKGPHPIFGL